MENKYNSDVIVVGAGPSGVACAIQAAKAGKKVVLLEKARFGGSKNMYGGAVYTHALKEIFEKDFDTIPYERIINSHTWSFLSENSSFDLTYKNSSSRSAYAIKRFELDRWMIERAKEYGVYFCPNTEVKTLVKKQNRVVGIKTELEEYYAPLVVLADGVNSLLARQMGLRKNFKPKDMLLTVKEVIKLDKSEIEKRFNLKDDLTQGVSKQYFGSDFGKLKGVKNLFMMTFLYTFKDTIALGLGVNLEDLEKNKLNISDVLDEIKLHPDIKPLIEGGELIEYSAHLIPEYGYKHLPKLYSDGVLVAGDAAGFVNGVHFEGTNFALMSGKIAGDTAISALNSKDYSRKKLKEYKDALQKSFILKDLYSYRNIMSDLRKRANSLSVYYPNKIKEFFEIFTGANCSPKAPQFRKFIFDFIRERSLTEFLKDGFYFAKCALEVLFGK